VTPSAANLSAPQKAALTARVQAAANSFVGALGVGEPIVYNRFVAALVGLDGVYDVSLDLFPKGAPPTGRASLSPPGDRRPRLAQLDVEIRGALVALDVTVAVERKGLAALADATTALSDIRGDISRRLQELLAALAGPINRGTLLARLSDTDTYSVKDLSYTADFVDEGLRITTPDMEIEPAGDQQPWLRSLKVGEAPGTT
jgi:hypothetical protein